MFESNFATKPPGSAKIGAALKLPAARAALGPIPPLVGSIPSSPLSRPRVDVDAWAEPMLKFLLDKECGAWGGAKASVRIGQIASDRLGVLLRSPAIDDPRRIARVLVRMGWKRSGSKIDGYCPGARQNCLLEGLRRRTIVRKRRLPGLRRMDVVALGLAVAEWKRARSAPENKRGSKLSRSTFDSRTHMISREFSARSAPTPATMTSLGTIIASGATMFSPTMKS